MEKKKRKLFALVIVAFGLGLRFSQAFRRALLLSCVKTESAANASLLLTRALLGHLFPPVLYKFWFRFPGHISQDGCQVLHNLEYKRQIKFGPHEREVLDILHPYVGEPAKEKNPINPSGIIHLGVVMAKEIVYYLVNGIPEERTPSLVQEKDQDAPAILFGHGGGWVCQGTDVQLQQLTPIARAGYAIYTYNYPLAPEDKFPAALITSLRAMSYLKVHHGYERIAVLGESAGGNLVTMAAALVKNPKLLKELSKEVEEPIDEWDYPDITCVASWYSILCSEHWQDAEWLSLGMKKVFEMYISGVFNDRVALLDLEEDLDVYPPSLLIGSSYDPLGLAHSSKAAHTMLENRGFKSTLSLYDATHGFVGYPIQMQQALAGGDSSHWESTCLKATMETIEFFRTHHKR